MSKKTTHIKERKQEVRNPLFNDIMSDRQINAKRRTPQAKGNAPDESFMPKGLSQKLLKEVRQQQNEEDDLKKDAQSSFLMDGASSDGEDNLTDYDEDYDDGEIEVDGEDDDALKMFMDTTGGKRILNLGELIMSKIKEKEMQADYIGNEAGPDAIASTLDPKVFEVYSQIATLLKRWKSGRLPRAVKIIPLLDNWEEIFAEQGQATGAITKIFASNFNEKLAQRYYNVILLPAIRADIKQHKKLNFHLWLSLKKALYKPTAFYKGLVIPLCESMECTLREAVIICSVLAKVSVPPIPSSVALMKIAQMPYSGPNSFFIKCLINKRYALPYRVIDALVEHFLKFREETRELPVVWHQSLLAFAQRYKEEISQEQKQQLKLLLREKNHPKITPEIRRELFSTKCRGQTELDMDVEMKM